MVEISTYQIGIFVFDLTFSIEKTCAKTRPKFRYPNVTNSRIKPEVMFLQVTAARMS